MAASAGVSCHISSVCCRSIGMCSITLVILLDPVSSRPSRTYCSVSSFTLSRSPLQNDTSWRLSLARNASSAISHQNFSSPLENFHFRDWNWMVSICSVVVSTDGYMGWSERVRTLIDSDTSPGIAVSLPLSLWMKRTGLYPSSDAGFVAVPRSLMIFPSHEAR